MRYLVTLSLLATSVGLILANYSVDATERYYARFVVAADSCFPDHGDGGMTRLQLTDDQGMSLFTKVDMNTPEPRENPDNEDTTLQDGVSCRGCDHFVLDASDEEAHKFNGWWYCGDCFYAMPEVQEALVRDLRAMDARLDNA